MTAKSNNWQDRMMQNKYLVALQNFGKSASRNKFISSIMGGVQSILGIMMVSAFAQVACAAGVLLKLIEKGSPVYNAIYTPYNFCMALLSLWLCFSMGNIYAKKHELKSPVVSAMTSVISFLIITDAVQLNEAGKTFLNTTYFGATGMITVFVTVFISINIIRFFEKRNLTFNLPKGLPEGLISSFVNLIPLLVNIIVFAVATALFKKYTGVIFPAWFMKVLAIPFGAVTSVPGMFIICAVMAIFTCCGVQGAMIIGPILLPMIMQALEQNAALYNAGQPLTYFPVLLFYCFGVFGVIPLCFLGWNSKSAQIKTISRAGLVPALFTVNGVVINGMPVLYNPILMIPYIINSLFSALMYHIAFSLKMLTPMWIYVTGNTPLGIKEYLWSMDWRHIVFAWLLVIPAMVIYYPFFKAYENQKIQEELNAVDTEAE